MLVTIHVVFIKLRCELAFTVLQFRNGIINVM